jgi:transposase-like protein
VWKCKKCGKQFSVKVGTIFEDSPVTLDKWLTTIWMIANAKNGISSYEIARALGVTQKSAWFMVHRIRLAMQIGSFEKLAGQVEVDETYIGGKARNMHKGARKAQGRGANGKTADMGLLEPHGKVVTKVVVDTKQESLLSEIDNRVAAGSEVFTDAFPAHRAMDEKFVHHVIDHAVEYVNGQVHTNDIENYWSLLKRTIKGTYVSVEPLHLFQCLDDQAFRFNNRKLNDFERFVDALRNISDLRLTYDKLIGNESGSVSFGSVAV